MEERYEFKASDLRYGVCVGGPMDGQMLAHHAAVYHLAISSMQPSRSYPGLTVATDPLIQFGRYVFEERKWHWKPPAEASSPG